MITKENRKMMDQIISINKHDKSANNYSSLQKSIDKRNLTMPLRLDSLNINVRLREDIRISKSNAKNKQRLNAIAIKSSGVTSANYPIVGFIKS